MATHDSWIDEPPGDRILSFRHKVLSAAPGPVLPESSWFEVPPTKLDPALSDLSASSWVALTEDQARYFAGTHYQCPTGQAAYLVRAVFMYGGTGIYILSRNEDDLLVEHSSLGQGPPEFHRAAIVVNLPRPPSRVFVHAHSAA